LLTWRISDIWRTSENSTVADRDDDEGAYKFELVINLNAEDGGGGATAWDHPPKGEIGDTLKTAKALGLTIPPSLLQRADQVIE
jgi:hypothetical protein